MRIALWPRFLIIFIFVASKSYAAEYIVSETTAAEDVSEADETLGSMFEEKQDVIDEERLNRRNFFKDSTTAFNFRGYQFERNNFDLSENYAISYGGELSFRSGTIKDTFTLGGSLYTTQPFDAPLDKDGTGLLAPGQQSITVLGQGYLNFRTKRYDINIGRSSFSLPYVNRDDSRMIPNTFEAVSIARHTKVFDLGVAYLDKIKQKDSEEFIPMSTAASAASLESGLAMAVGRYNFPSGMAFGAQYFRNFDVFDTLYSESTWNTRIFSDRAGLKLSAQLTLQNSVGKEAAGKLDAESVGVKAATSFAHAVLNYSYVQNGDGSRIVSPFGGRPVYNSMMLSDFDRAGEKSHRLGFSYKFTRFGLTDLSMIYNFVTSRNAVIREVDIMLPKQQEQNITLDYRSSSGPFKGLWVRLRYAEAASDDIASTRDNFRLIVNYKLDI